VVLFFLSDTLIIEQEGKGFVNLGVVEERQQNEELRWPRAAEVSGMVSL